VRGLILIALLASVAAFGQTADRSGTLLVANRTGGSISMIDLATDIEIARLPIGPAIPHEVAVSADGRWAVTGEYGGNANPGRHVVVIDVVNARIAGRIDLGPNSRPHSLAFMPDGRRVVATMESSDRIALVDIVNLAVLRTYPTAGREGHMVRLSPDGVHAYVASRGAEGTLSVIALREALPPVVIPTGAGAEGLAVSPDGTEVWVVNRTADSISVVNTGTRRVVATLPARSGAGRAEISAAGRVFVPNGRSATEESKYLTVYDLASRRMRQELPMNDGQLGGGGYGIHIAGERAFVADRADRSIAIYDLTDLSLVRTIETAHPDPDGLAYSPVRVAAMEAR
jgi:YVTN family beta-propeller protein